MLRLGWSASNNQICHSLLILYCLALQESSDNLDTDSEIKIPNSKSSLKSAEQQERVYVVQNILPRPGVLTFYSFYSTANQ